jgi:hypothetical protein
MEMLGSPFEPERANAAALANRFIRDRNLIWTDVLGAAPLTAASPFSSGFAPGAPPKSDGATAEAELKKYQDMAKACLSRAALQGRFSQRELEFIRDMIYQSYPLTPKQQHWLEALFNRG